MATLANYYFTNEAGTVRRRANEIRILFPTEKQGEPVVTFIEEDRAVLADGNEMLVPTGGQRSYPVSQLLSLAFPQIDLETGTVNGEPRQGFQLFQLLQKALVDIYITTGEMENEKIKANQAFLNN